MKQRKEIWLLEREVCAEGARPGVPEPWAMGEFMAPTGVSLCSRVESDAKWLSPEPVSTQGTTRVTPWYAGAGVTTGFLVGLDARGALLRLGQVPRWKCSLMADFKPSLGRCSQLGAGKTSAVALRSTEHA